MRCSSVHRTNSSEVTIEATLVAFFVNYCALILIVYIHRSFSVLRFVIGDKMV